MSNRWPIKGWWLLLLGLAACGQKGELYRPTPPADPPSPTTAK